MFTFEWDSVKAVTNVRKHGVSFDEAVGVYGDANAITFRDSDHSEAEDRSRTYGFSGRGGLLVVVHAERRRKAVARVRDR